MNNIELLLGFTGSAVVGIILLIVFFRIQNRDRLLAKRIEQLDQLAQRLNRFEEALTVPQKRGALGEQLLEDLLATWLPRSSFETQATFSSGVRVDATVKIGERIVPIDSKFPFEIIEGISSDKSLEKSGRRGILRYVSSIAKKYILPDEGTYNFALIYLPSDALYLRCFAGPATHDLLGEALRRRVVPVGPSSLYLYLNTIGHAMRGLRLTSGDIELADMLQRASDETSSLLDVSEQINSLLLKLSRTNIKYQNHLRSLDLSLHRMSEPTPLSRQ